MASTVSLIQMLAAGMTTSAGLPVASGRARFYLPATLTSVSVYSDSLAATPISAPLVLTAGGTGIAYTKVPTRMIVKDSTDTTTIFDGLVNIERAEQQYIQSASLNGGTETTMQAFLDAMSTSLGGTAGLWKFKATTGATEQNFVDVLNALQISVKSFGAVGDGIVNDTTAIQNTATYVASLGGGVVYFPPGTYLISSPIVATVGMAFVGAAPVGPAGLAVSTIKNSHATGNALTLSGTAISLRNLKITHSTSSSGAAVSATTLSLFIYDSFVDGHLSGIVGVATGSTGIASFVNVSATSSGAGTAASSAIDAVVVGGKYSSTAGTSFATGGTKSTFVGTDFGSTSAVGLDVTTGTTAYAIGCTTTSTIGLRMAATAGAVQHHGCNWGTVTDGRTGAPVAYTFAANGNFTPLPLQTDAIRVIGTAGGITITINAAAAIGFGRKVSMMLINSTGGACTFTFNAQYKLQGGAAPNPATGNLIISTFEYDPISSVYRETSRSASMAI